MRIGLIARADRSGLAVQTWEFYRNMHPVKTLVINPTWVAADKAYDATMYQGEGVEKMTSRPYPESAMTATDQIDGFLDDLDVVFTCETPYNFWLFKRAREKGVKSFLQYNFEFFEWGTRSDMPMPDVLVAPSLWRWDDVPFEKVFLPVPVNRHALPYRRRTELKTILHSAGSPAMKDRNGSLLLVEAMRLLPPDVDVMLHIHSQVALEGRIASDRVRYDLSIKERYFDNYDDEDVYVMPRKFGGLCLPLNEASACGMPVIMSNTEPQSLFLPLDALVEASQVDKFMTRAMIGVFESKPQAIADKITELYRNPDLVQKLSDASNAYADSISWDRMGPIYLETFGRYL